MKRTVDTFGGDRIGGVGIGHLGRFAIALIVASAALASAQPAPSGSAGSSTTLDFGSADSTGSATGLAGSAGSGSTGSAGVGSGLSGSAGSGFSGSGTGSAGSATGSGTGSAIIIQLDPEAPEVSAAASPTELKLGQRFTLFVRAIMSQGIEVNLREPLDLGAAFEVGKRVSEDRIQPDGRRMREWQLEVRVWELGDVRIPPIAVTYTQLGKAAQVETNTVPLHVTGVLGDSDDPKLMREQAAPMQLQEKSFLAKLLEWFEDPTHLAIVIGALVGMWLGWRFRKLRRRRVTRLVGGLVPMRAQRRVLDMTSERALERLLSIEQSGQLAKDDQRRAAYADMSDVIRDYLGARYSVLTTEMTSAELLKALTAKVSDTDKTRITQWIDGADLVKYGNFPASRDEAYATLEGARRLVITTTAPQNHGKTEQVAAS